MLDLLLQAQPVNAMSDVTFTLGDLITMGGGAVATISAFIKLQYDQKSEAKATVVRFATMEKDHEKEVSGLDEKILHIQNGKRALKKDLIIMIEKEAEITKNRIDKTQERIEEDKRQNQIEFKEINKVLNQILGYVKK